MHIIIEGPDGAGKSTLAKKLSETLRFPIVPGEGPEKFKGEILERIAKNNKLMATSDVPLIFDRHSIVSHPIYSAVGGNYSTVLTPDLMEPVYQNAIVIYCRAPDQTKLGKHEEREGIDTEQHTRMIAENHPTICRMYDQWALDRANFIYRMGQTRLTTVINFISGNDWRFDPIEDIREFHEKFGLGYNGPPRMLPADMARFRFEFMREELQEYYDYCPFDDKLYDSDEAKSFAMEKTFDALIDEVYVALGTAYLHGYDFREGWRRVHEANMTKTRVENIDDSTRKSKYDVIKPKGWRPPKLTDLVQSITTANPDG